MSSPLAVGFAQRGGKTPAEAGAQQREQNMQRRDQIIDLQRGGTGGPANPGGPPTQTQAIG